MSTISERAGKAMRGCQQGWPKVTVPMAGTVPPTSLGAHRPAATIGRMPPVSTPRRNSPFLPPFLRPEREGVAVFHFQTGCLQP